MQPTQGTDFTPSGELLAVSLGLSKNNWKIALHDSKRDKPSMHAVASEQAAKRLEEAAAVIEAMKKKWGLPERTRTVVIYEAGQDGLPTAPPPLAIEEPAAAPWITLPPR